MGQTTAKYHNITLGDAEVFAIYMHLIMVKFNQNAKSTIQHQYPYSGY
jgi:hypothetical protein